VARCSGDQSPQTLAAPDLAALFRPNAAHDGRASATGQSAGNGLAESAQYKGGHSLPVSQPTRPFKVKRLMRSMPLNPMVRMS
jgi:hypothetical protein